MTAVPVSRRQGENVFPVVPENVATLLDTKLVMRKMQRRKEETNENNNQ